MSSNTILIKKIVDKSIVLYKISSE